MHNCKSAKNSLIDLALDELPSARSRQLLAELNACPACRDEYAALRSTLHVSGQALRSISPGENFWPGYHSRLRHSLLTGSIPESEHRLNDASAPVQTAGISNSFRLWLALRALLTTSVRIPVPAVVALMVLFVISVVGLRSHEQVKVIPTAPLAAVEIRADPAPVVQERVITRVVYVERKSNRPSREQWSREQWGREQLNRSAASNLARSLAGSASAGSGKTALNLAGFEPTDQVRLTVIKGSYRDDK
jgi:anti-sigma factor RsiW